MHCAGKMGQWVEAISTKPDNMSRITETNMVREEPTPKDCPLTSKMSDMIFGHVHTHTHSLNKCNFKKEYLVWICLYLFAFHTNIKWSQAKIDLIRQYLLLIHPGFHQQWF